MCFVFFLRLNNIPLYVKDHILIIHSSVVEAFGLLSLWQLDNVAIPILFFLSLLKIFWLCCTVCEMLLVPPTRD